MSKSVNPFDRQADYAKRQVERLSDFAGKIAPAFLKIVEAFEKCQGNICVMGAGKSYALAQRTTLALQGAGLKAQCMHPGDLLYGSACAIGPKDLVFLISGSGESEEILSELPWLKQAGALVVSLTPSSRSSIGRASSLAVGAGRSELEEDEPFSTAFCLCASLLGDLIARHFARAGGSGAMAGGRVTAKSQKKDRVTVADVIAIRGQNPAAPGKRIFKDALMEMTAQGLGAIAVTDPRGKLIGIMTDGDVRRLLQKSQGSLARLFLTSIDGLMTANPATIAKSKTISEAIKLMEDRAITVLPVVDKGKKPVGMIHLHDLVKLGLMEKKEPK